MRRPEEHRAAKKYVGRRGALLPYASLANLHDVSDEAENHKDEKHDEDRAHGANHIALPSSAAAA